MFYVKGRMMLTLPPGLVEAAEKRAREAFRKDATGHDWHHTDRVRKVAIAIAIRESADVGIVEVGALLHDVWDWKLYHPISKGPWESCRIWLADQDVDSIAANKIADCATKTSYLGADVPDQTPNLEAKCVMDAGRRLCTSRWKSCSTQPESGQSRKGQHAKRNL